MHLTKHHGLGNDFLVLIDADDRSPIDGDLARAMCDRHRGVGADGILRVTVPGAGRVRMELRNGDGSRAEMSGNGISCLAQAVVRAGLVEGDEVVVDTDAGERVVAVVARESSRAHRMRVVMGVPRIGDDLPEWVDRHVLRAVAVDMGNPHVVCHVPDPTDAPDLVALGQRINAALPAGANVELVSPASDGIRMLVYERGVGPTLACGTGAVAAAAAARTWGLVGETVTVHQPGGPAVVELAGDGPADLTVPVVAVAEIDWPECDRADDERSA